MKSDKTAFSDADELTLADYKPMHWAAIATFVTGIFSSLAIVKTLFLPIAGMAFVFAVITFVSSRFSDQKHAGLTLCTIGFCLAIFFASWRVGHDMIRHRVVFSDSVQYCEAWLEHLKKKEKFIAYQLTKRYLRRELPGTDLKEKYTKVYVKNPELMMTGGLDPQSQMYAMGNNPTDEFNMFYSKYPMNLVSKYAPTAKFEHVRKEMILSSTARDSISNVYLMTYDESGVEKSLEFRIITERLHYDVPFNVQWRVESVVDMSQTPQKH